MSKPSIFRHVLRGACLASLAGLVWACSVMTDPDVDDIGHVSSNVAVNGPASTLGYISAYGLVQNWGGLGTNRLRAVLRCTYVFSSVIAPGTSELPTGPGTARYDGNGQATPAAAGQAGASYLNWTDADFAPGQNPFPC